MRRTDKTRDLLPPARTRTTDTLSVAEDAEFGSAAQRERRKRILDATLALASKGGYDAVQMRTVAERADVALGTLYRYFPSKIHSRPACCCAKAGPIQARDYNKFYSRAAGQAAGGRAAGRHCEQPKARPGDQREP